MKVYVAVMSIHSDTEVLAVCTSRDIAIGKIEKKMEELYEKNEDFGAYSEIMEFNIDGVADEDYF